ncbi:ankyrin repeat-containing domain protein, partial [Vararia minispora EC-137]
MDADALTTAAGYGSIDTICLLLDNGANIEGRGQDGETALQAAFGSREDRSDVIQLLLDRGAQLQMDARTLLAAARGGSTDNIRLLIDHGANIEGRDQLGQTALKQAAFYGHLEVMQLLLDHGVQPQMDADALTTAARYGSIDTICLLLDNGADIEGRD